jgi:hypothetical protein
MGKHCFASSAALARRQCGTCFCSFVRHAPRRWCRSSINTNVVDGEATSAKNLHVFKRILFAVSVAVPRDATTVVVGDICRFLEKSQVLSGSGQGSRKIFAKLP